MDLESVAATTPMAQAEFTCSRGHGRAGAVRLHRGAPDEWVVVVDSFVCRMLSRLEAPRADPLQAVLHAADVEALHRLDVEFAPFFCPRCVAVYCGVCWRQYEVFDDEMPGWHEETRGVCPAGHDRMLVD